MRDVKFVKQKRDELKEEMIKYDCLLHKFRQVKKYEEMDKKEKSIYSYFYQSKMNLSIQINTLEFILNEDTYLTDETKVRNKYLIDNNITKKDILKELEK